MSREPTCADKRSRSWFRPMNFMVIAGSPLPNGNNRGSFLLIPPAIYRAGHNTEISRSVAAARAHGFNVIYIFTVTLLYQARLLELCTGFISKGTLLYVLWFSVIPTDHLSNLRRCAMGGGISDFLFHLVPQFLTHLICIRSHSIFSISKLLQPSCFNLGSKIWIVSDIIYLFV